MDLDDTTFRAFLQEDKVLDVNIEWKMLGVRQRIMNVEVLTSVLPKKVVFGGQINEAGVFGFWLMYQGEHIVHYCQCVHPTGYKHPHIEDGEGKIIRKGEITDEKHKYKFKKDCPRQLMIKIIPDSEINPSNVNEALFQFLEECKIRIEGEYTPFDYEYTINSQTMLCSYEPKITEHLIENEKS